MLFVRACKSLMTIAALSGALIASPAFAGRTHRGATSGHSRSAKKKAASHQIHGQRQIDPERAREIQTALIRAHYLTGEPTGQWDAESQAAMTRYQGDQGWQTKITPDSRALIKLGLGPNQQSSVSPAGTPAMISQNGLVTGGAAQRGTQQPAGGSNTLPGSPSSVSAQ